jgi:hypothetical protein
MASDLLVPLPELLSGASDRVAQLVMQVLAAPPHTPVETVLLDQGAAKSKYDLRTFPVCDLRTGAAEARLPVELRRLLHRTVRWSPFI